MEENIAERPGGGEKRQMAERLEPALEVVGLHQLEEEGPLDRAAVPSDLKVLADVVQRLGIGGHLQRSHLSALTTSDAFPAEQMAMWPRSER